MNLTNGHKMNKNDFNGIGITIPKDVWEMFKKDPELFMKIFNLGLQEAAKHDSRFIYRPDLSKPIEDEHPDVEYRVGQAIVPNIKNDSWNPFT